MAVEARFGLQRGVEFGLGKEARARERSIERAGAVALAHHEAVAIRGLGVGWIDSKNIEIERRDDVRRRKIAPRMPLPRVDDHPQHPPPHPARARANVRDSRVFLAFFGFRRWLGYLPHRSRSQEHTSELQSLIRIYYAV